MSTNITTSQEDTSLKNEQTTSKIFDQINNIQIKKYFNKITYIQYYLEHKNNPKLNFLLDYSKILGKDSIDPKIIDWEITNQNILSKIGINISILNQRKEEIGNLYLNNFKNLFKNLNL